MSFTLRGYQRASVDAIYDYLSTTEEGNPLVVLPTGAGKTPVLATLARDVVESGGRVLILSHVKELIQQSRDTIARWSPDLAGSVGVYSAGLRERTTDTPIVVASIQSVHQRAGELGAFDLVIVDEAHLIPPTGEGMYQRFLDRARIVNPHLRVCGLTATPYRLRSGTIVGGSNILDELVYEANVRDLIEQGYLCELTSRQGAEHIDTRGLAVKRGEYVEEEVDHQVDAIMTSACREIAALTADSKGVLIFAHSVKYAERVADHLLSEYELDVGTVFGHTPSADRDETLQAFKEQRLRYIVNVNVLTTGFDATHVDAIVLLRPTQSPGLYAQMVGRGLRLHPQKERCLVLDYAENAIRHGPIDAIREPGEKGPGDGEPLMKACQSCQALNLLQAKICVECGKPFPVDEKPKHARRASAESILSTPATNTWHDVDRVEYREWTSRKNPTGTPTLRVDYHCGLLQFSEWICLEHAGYPGTKAEAWWVERCEDGGDPPRTIHDAFLRSSDLVKPTKIKVRSQAGEYDRVTEYLMPDPVPYPDTPDDGIPF